MSIRTLPDLTCATALAAVERVLPDSLTALWNPDVVADAQKPAQAVIDILQPIGSGLFAEGFTAQRMAAALRSIGPRDVTIRINSPGGRIDEGTAIYNMLRQHKGRVDVEVLAIAGSIASVIAMAGDSIRIAKSGFIFVHNGEVGVIGNKHVLRDMVTRLEEFDAMMTGVYADRTGQSEREIQKLLDGKKFDGTLMNATVAIDKGFADALLPGEVKTKQQAGATASAVLAVRRLEELATTAATASRGDVRALLKEIKAGMRDAAGAAVTLDADGDGDAKPDAGVSAELAAMLARIQITPLTKAS